MFAAPQMKKIEGPKKIERGNCAVFDLPTLQEATDNFHEKNKLGKGGFGAVFRVSRHNMQERSIMLTAVLIVLWDVCREGSLMDKI
jgi:hypothetical protein